MTKRLNETILIERHWIRIEPLPSDSFMGHNLSTYQEREIGDPTRTKLLGMNTALLTKWVAMIMGPLENLAKLILKDNYDRGPDRVSRFALTRGASLFWQSQKQIFPWVCEFF